MERLKEAILQLRPSSPPEEIASVLAQFRPRRFWGRLRNQSLQDEAHRVEVVLASARAFLAFGALIAISIDPTEPRRYAAMALVLLTLYAIYSSAVLMWLHFHEEAPRRLRWSLHAVDILWPAVITLFTEGPNSPFFLFFFFVLVSAAYRWGFLETIATTGTTVALLLGEGLLLTPHGWSIARLVAGQYELNRFFMRAIYLFIAGVLLGHLGEEEKRLRAEAALVANLVSKAQTQKELRATLREVFGGALEIFGAERLLFAVRGGTAGRCFLWEAKAAAGHEEVLLGLEELDAEGQAKYFFDFPGQAWHATCRASPGGHRTYDSLTLDAAGRRVRHGPVSLPPTFQNSHSFKSLLGLSLDSIQDWSGRVFILDPALLLGRKGTMRFFQTLFAQVAPAVYNVYLFRRLRAQAGAVERARLGRELHDGVIQTLLGLEMEVAALRSRNRAEGLRPGADSSSPTEEAQAPVEPSSRSGELETRLARIQQMLHEEVLNVRELMQQIRPLELSPGQLLEFLADFVDRFRRDTGIVASFVSDLEELPMAPRVCREVGRIVQEALINIRRHSGAKNVVVRLGAENDCWKLVIDDDGRGFQFSGRLSQAELDAARKGPLVIKERVRSIGGTLAVESTPGRGARLEVTLPKKVHG